MVVGMRCIAIEFFERMKIIGLLHLGVPKKVCTVHSTEFLRVCEGGWNVGGEIFEQAEVVFADSAWDFQNLCSRVSYIYTKKGKVKGSNSYWNGVADIFLLSSNFQNLWYKLLFQEQRSVFIVCQTKFSYSAYGGGCSVVLFLLCSSKSSFVVEFDFLKEIVGISWIWTLS